ncbi:CpaF family protein, partial [Brevundimonas sp.]|uniref:CpaF family protein n=1 Tax=Brevundimonas sp. TaxID=1871086 RepID=UPI001A1D0C9D
MFGKRTGSSSPSAPLAPASGSAGRPAPEQPDQGVQTQAFAFADEAPQAAAPFGTGGTARQAEPSGGADRLDALAARPKPAASAPPPATNGPGPKATPAFEQLKKAQAVTEIVREQSDYYHATKTTIFNALMNTIDLSQLAQLDTKAASEEIRDIVAELVAIKNVSMSVAEQEHLVQDIVNDVLGYGPLEPLLARDDIADIMVNGAGRVFIEVNGKVQLTNVRFRDNTQLMNICQRIVSQVGRRVDESSPICDARLPDGSRVNVIAPPLAIDGATLTIRKFKKDKLTMKNLVEYASISPEGARVLGVIGACRCNIVISGGTGSGKTTLLNTLTAFIDPTERVITCEDAAELQLQQPHVV